MKATKALFQDHNWLKIIGIVVVLFATLLFSQCSQDFIYRSQVNAPLLVRSICLSQIYTYENTGRFIENLAGQGLFPNPYPEFYKHLTRYEANQVFHYATSKSPHLKSYVGLVVGFPKTTQPITAKSGSVLPLRKQSAIAIVCEATKPGAIAANNPHFDGSTLTCSSQTRQVGDVLSIK